MIKNINRNQLHVLLNIHMHVLLNIHMQKIIKFVHVDKYYIVNVQGLEYLNLIVTQFIRG